MNQIAEHSFEPVEPVTLSGPDILANAVELVPQLRTNSVEIEEARRLTPSVVKLLRDAGVFRAAMPKEWGGPAMTSVEQTRLVEIISTGDTSAGWCAMIGMDSGIYSGFLRIETARKLYPSLDMANSGWIHPQGRADHVDGGYLVSGNWRFGSGVTHCDVLVAGCRVYRNGEPEADPRTGDAVQWRIAVAKPADFTINDTWNTTGLAGSGSLDYAVTNLFVPAEHTFSFNEPFRPGPLHSAPDAILRKMSGVPLGLARACLDYVRSEAKTRSDRESGIAWIESPRIRTSVAKAEMRLKSVRSAVYATLEDQWERLQSGAQATTDDRVATALARFHAFRTAREIVQEMYDLIGASSIYKPSPMDRWLRDATTMCQHAVAQDSILDLTGSVLLGGNSRSPFF
ncbi:MAG: acyl-CoA dehydrogenase family protein [Alphaproteobacteria bacterium]|nr:acyl-CoA dehydrogenase family protein [Alphaproteobacteria bacterium]MBU2229945.1 acyl-CoA dehydrogenase family protein [Alphaproteobacteria bacterium]